MNRAEEACVVLQRPTDQGKWLLFSNDRGNPVLESEAGLTRVNNRCSAVGAIIDKMMRKDRDIRPSH